VSRDTLCKQKNIHPAGAGNPSPASSYNGSRLAPSGHSFKNRTLACDWRHKLVGTPIVLLFLSTLFFRSHRWQASQQCVRIQFIQAIGIWFEGVDFAWDPHPDTRRPAKMCYQMERRIHQVTSTATSSAYLSHHFLYSPKSEVALTFYTVSIRSQTSTPNSLSF
jgi:hypothetical protein